VRSVLERSSRNFQKLLDLQEKMVVVRWAGVEIEVFAKALRLVVLRLNEDGADAGDVGGLQCSRQRMV
jgi:hypothetical protein